MPLVTLRPLAMGNNDNWTANTGTKPTQINNTPADDTRFLQAFAPGQIDAYTVDAAPADLQFCTGLKIRARIAITADPGILCRFRGKVFTIGPVVQQINVSQDFSGIAAATEVEIGEVTGLALTQAEVSSFRFQALSEDSSGWVFGNAVMGLMEYYLDVTYTSLSAIDVELRAKEGHARLDANAGDMRLSGTAGNIRLEEQG